VLLIGTKLGYVGDSQPGASALHSNFEPSLCVFLSFLSFFLSFFLQLPDKQQQS